ncbi:MAG TPA: Wzz/FepE/Etk N-terminal domain-containing protein [Bacillota bacterium]|nr:Wzz/FepE/Etk N-terminal domain-containing protein [Bacillota bacterium]HOK68284.1 Wzz/FepE/Etk N-terminal domain-containing protein [Bacillota bacterium]HPP84498.1 Wzz/FepE/Etk N-terminal domain-containing protein [Bacillota bacterium]
MEFTYEKFFKLIKEHLIVILAGGILCFAAAFAYSKFMIDPVYYSQSKIGIQSEKQISPANPTVEINYARMIVSSYLEILDSHDFYEQVYQSIPDEYKPSSPEELRKNTSLTIKDNTEVIQIQYNSTDRDKVQFVTSKIVEKICTYTPLTESYKANVSIYESATAPKVSNDNITLFSIVGFVLGIVIVFVIVLLKDMLDTRVKTVNDLKERYNVPVLGAIPTFKGKKLRREDNLDG